jgi:hypothetical protein
MDIYLPADFHELRNAAADDWRDAPSHVARELRPEPDDEAVDPVNGCADPLWRVF